MKRSLMLAALVVVAACTDAQVATITDAKPAAATASQRPTTPIAPMGTPAPVVTPSVQGPRPETPSSLAGLQSECESDRAAYVASKTKEVEALYDQKRTDLQADMQRKGTPPTDSLYIGYMQRIERDQAQSMVNLQNVANGRYKCTPPNISWSR